MLSVYVLLGGLSTIVSPCLSSVTNEYILVTKYTLYVTVCACGAVKQKKVFVFN